MIKGKSFLFILENVLCNPSTHSQQCGLVYAPPQTAVYHYLNTELQIKKPWSTLKNEMCLNEQRVPGFNLERSD